MGEEKMLWFFGVRRRYASRNHGDDVVKHGADFTLYGGGFSGLLQIRFFFRMSGGVCLARLRFIESVFGLSRSKWTLSASNQYPKVVQEVEIIVWRAMGSSGYFRLLASTKS
ncbi:hypothetical protein Bca4012_005859 [Brassica carinata]